MEMKGVAEASGLRNPSDTRAFLAALSDETKTRASGQELLQRV